MTTYTGVADVNGDFTVPFSQNYTGGQKVTVTAEKDAATKKIELFAPSDVIGGGVITWSNTNANFPRDIGEVTIGDEVDGAIADYAFFVGTYTSFGGNATGLTITSAKTVGSNAFRGWSSAKFLNLPPSLISIGVSAFYGWSAALSLIIPNSVTTIENDAFLSWGRAKTLVIGRSVGRINSYAFSGWGAVLEVTILAATPPLISSNTFQGINSSCIFKVPAASLAAYQAAPNWSVFAGRMVGV